MTAHLAPLVPTPAPHRRWRASILAFVVVYLAVLGHLSGGGMVPDLPAVALASALTWPVCWQLSALRRGFPTILAVLALAQPVLHVVLEFSGALLAGAAGTSAGHHTVTVVADQLSTPGTAGVLTGAGSMLAFHAVAALLSAVVLARGEKALTGMLAAGRRIASWVVSVLAALAGAPTPTVDVLARPDVRSLPPRRSISLPARHGRRGPPRVLGAH